MPCGKKETIPGKFGDMSTDNFWKGKRVFITGATGFLGSHIASELHKKGAKLTLLSRKNITEHPVLDTDIISDSNIVTGDILSLELLENILNKYKPDTIFHTAGFVNVGEAFKNPELAVNTNTIGTHNILEALRRNPSHTERFIMVSSDKVYGNSPDLPSVEEDPIGIVEDIYSASKSAAEILARTYFHSYGLPIAISRCANFMGGGDLHFERIIPGTIRSALRNEDPTIRGNGLAKRDFLYIKDAANAHLTLAENLQRDEVAGQVFNFAMSSPVTMKELVNKIVSLTNPSLEPAILNDPSTDIEIKYQHLSAEKAKKVLGWEPEYDLSQGLSETINWYKNYLNI